MRRPDIAHHHVAIRKQRRHHLDRLLPVIPQFIAVIEIHRYHQSFAAGRLQRFFAYRPERLVKGGCERTPMEPGITIRSEEHTSELQSRENLVCRLLLEKKK